MPGGRPKKYTPEFIENEAAVAIAPICFPAGTPVTTDQGNIAIEKLNSHIHTITIIIPIIW